MIVFSVCSTVLMVLLPEARTVCLFIDSAARFSLNLLMPSFALDTFRLGFCQPLASLLVELVHRFVGYTVYAALDAVGGVFLGTVLFGMGGVFAFSFVCT